MTVLVPILWLVGAFAVSAALGAIGRRFGNRVMLVLSVLIVVSCFAYLWHSA